MGAAPIHYVFKRFPDLTATFVVDEVLALEAMGETVLIDSLELPREGPRHPGLAAMRAEVRYVPERPSMWESWRAHAFLALRRPMAWIRAVWNARRTSTRDELRRAAVLGHRCSRARARYVHTHFALYAADVAAVAARLAGRPFTITAHANDIWNVAYAPHLKRRLSAADRVITVSEYNARHLRSVAPETPVHVVPLATGQADPAPAPADGPILCVARLIPKKGVDTLIRAFALLADERPGLRLELIGAGRSEDRLRALASELEIERRITFRGAQPPQVVHEAYERCSVVALACRIAEDGDRDGLPVALLEALARALPVVTTTVVGIPEVVQDRVTGLLVPPDDSEALATALVELLDDRELARRLGASGRQLMMQTRTHAARVDALRRLLT